MCRLSAGLGHGCITNTHWILERDTREKPSSGKSGQYREPPGYTQPMEFQQWALTDSALLQGDLNPHPAGDAFLRAFGTSGSLRKRSHFPLYSNKQTKHFSFCSKVGCDLVSHTETPERRRNSVSLPQSELTRTPRQGWIQHGRFSPQLPSQAPGTAPQQLPSQDTSRLESLEALGALFVC